jgi:hypothetical protein
MDSRTLAALHEALMKCLKRLHGYSLVPRSVLRLICVIPIAILTIIFRDRLTDLWVSRVIDDLTGH